MGSDGRGPEPETEDMPLEFHAEVWFGCGDGYTRKFSSTEYSKVIAFARRYTSDARAVRTVDDAGALVEQVKAESGMR